MPQKRPNILMIMADDHAASAISAYGSILAEVFRTPHLDRLAAGGVRVDRCFCTNAICTPSRASILTGLHGHACGVRTLSDALDADADTFPRRLRAAGYQTGLYGKWHVHCPPAGFDDYRVLPGQGVYFNPHFLGPGDDWASSYHAHHSEGGTRHRGYVTDLVTDFTVEALRNRDRDRPFLFCCHHKAPHDDFEYHPRHEHLFDGVDVPEPDNLWEDHARRAPCTRHHGTSVSDRNPVRNAILRMSDPAYPTGPLDVRGLDADGRTRAAYQKYLKDYLRCCAAIDEGVGRLLDTLEEEGLAEDTLVLYTSDQGMFLGEHDYIDKRWIYDEAMRMPLIARLPGEIPAGGTNGDMISNVDFAPTLLDYAGLAAPDAMQGRSFRANLAGDAAEDWPKGVYYRYWMHMAHHHNPAHYGLRTRDHKLIHFYGLPLDATDALPGSTPPGWEYYDLRSDPAENVNRIDDPACAAVIAGLKKQLLALKEELGDADDRYPEMAALPTALTAGSA
ncbi:sulfatase family protein [Phycisphaera mikurensis]|nr:sulfatase [Phycisphaera mikurensis]MBB6441590.1 arylsulfatase A-like enzyme [Phycisphaera mikurensis]